MSTGRLVHLQFRTGGLQSAGDWVRDDLYMRSGAGASTSRGRVSFFRTPKIHPTAVMASGAASLQW